MNERIWTAALWIFTAVAFLAFTIANLFFS